MIRRRATAATLLMLAVLLAPASALAAACPRTSLPDIEREVMCPVCKTPLALAEDAPQANRERAFILERVARCESKTQIKAALAAEFGPDVLALPRPRGFNLAAYVVPGLALLVGLVVAVGATLRWRRRRPEPAVATALVDPDSGGGDTPRTAASSGAQMRGEAASSSPTGGARPSSARRFGRDEPTVGSGAPPGSGSTDSTNGGTAESGASPYAGGEESSGSAAARLDRELERYDT